MRSLAPNSPEKQRSSFVGGGLSLLPLPMENFDLRPLSPRQVGLNEETSPPF